MKTPTALAASTWKRIILSAVLVTVELWAFSLSFDHHVKTAIGSGYSPQLAPLYPLVIDGAIVASTLVLIWWPALSRGSRFYIWSAIGIWTLLSGINNAISILTDKTTVLAFPVEVAIAVNTVPTITQFLVLHIVYLALHSDQKAPAHVKAAPNTTTIWGAVKAKLTGKTAPDRVESPSRPTTAQTDTQPRSPRKPRTAVEGLPTDAELYQRNLAGETVEEITATLDGARKKTWVHEGIKRGREASEGQGGPARDLSMVA